MSIICNMWIRRIVNANPAIVWRNASIIHRRYAQAFSKGENDVIPVEKAHTNLQKRSQATSIKGETAVKEGRNLLNRNQRQDLLLFITERGHWLQFWGSGWMASHQEAYKLCRKENR
ncbi:uncharacterized protein LOC131029285 isoform X2 [Cryptomeria japonica]|uniref:uncharacterized protein LOC131029285 isoform X2 n=1 Tax=Cryptomeria japonica TaxID=3369 RepID=UPI0027DA419A|nr:uncharacterized protein LOC131029285 isoform X2 [Cryptomeria japonica]